MKRIFVALVILLVVFAAALGIGLWKYTDTVLRWGAAGYWKATTGQTLVIGEIDFSTTHVSIDRIEIREPDGSPFLDVAGLDIQTTGWVQETHYQVDTFQIDRLDLFVKRQPDGRWNVQELGDKFASEEGTEDREPGPVAGAALTPWIRDRFFVGEVKLPEINLHVQDRGPDPRLADVDFRNIRLEVKNFGNLNPDQPAAFQAEGVFPKKLGGGPMRIDGEATPFARPDSMNVNGRFDNVDPTYFSPYLAEAGYQVNSGRISTRFRAASTDPNLEGHVDVTLFDFSMSLKESKREKGFLGLSDEVLNQFLKSVRQERIDVGLDLRGTREEPKFNLDETTKVMIAKKVGGMALKQGLMVLNPAAGGTLLGVEKLEEKLGIGDKLKRKLFGKE